MPYPLTHTDCALWYCKVSWLKWKNKKLFILWTLLPDLKIDWILNRNITHYYEWENYFESNFVNNFIENEYEKLSDFRNNYLIFWYLFHLITDSSFIINEIKLQKWSIDEFMWDFRRNQNSLADKLYNPQIITELANTKYTIEKITKNQLPKSFQWIDLALISNNYTTMIDEVIKHSDNPFQGYFSNEELEREIHTLSKMQSIDNTLRLFWVNPPSEQNVNKTWNSNLQH